MPRKPNGWIATHDDRWSFTIAYVGVALALSTLVSLFWLVAVVAGHALLEWFALARRGVGRQRFMHVLWHLKLDIGLVLLALALALYFDVLLGLVGLGAATRTGAQLTARIVAWQRAIRGIALSADDVALVARATLTRRTSTDAASRLGDDPADQAPERPWAWPWSTGERSAVAFVAIMAVLIALAPFLTEHSTASALAAIAVELRPLP